MGIVAAEDEDYVSATVNHLHAAADFGEGLMNIRTFVASCYLMLFATSVFAQQTKPQGNGALAEGPFGLTFGRPLGREDYKIRSKIDFQKDGGEFANALDVSPDEKLKRRCVTESFTTTSIVPNSWKGSVDSIYGAGKVPSEASKISSENKLGIDLGVGGDLTGGIYEIPVGDKNRNICLVFFKHNLFLVFSFLDEFKDLPTSINAALDKKYGTPKTFHLSQIMVKTWEIEKDRLSIVLFMPDRYESTVAYTFYPIKSLQIKALVDANWQKFRDAVRKTPF